MSYRSNTDRLRPGSAQNSLHRRRLRAWKRRLFEDQVNAKSGKIHRELGPLEPQAKAQLQSGK